MRKHSRPVLYSPRGIVLSGKSNRSFMNAKNSPLLTMGVPPGPSFTLLPDPIVTNTGRLLEDPLVVAVGDTRRVNTVRVRSTELRNVMLNVCARTALVLGFLHCPHNPLDLRFPQLLTIAAR